MSGAASASALLPAAAGLSKARQQPRTIQKAWAIIKCCAATALGYDISLYVVGRVVVPGACWVCGRQLAAKRVRMQVCVSGHFCSLFRAVRLWACVCGRAIYCYIIRAPAAQF